MYFGRAATRRASLSGVCACLVFALLPVGIAAAGPPEDPAAPMDVKDVWHLIRHRDDPADPPLASQRLEKPFIAVVPSISSKPSTGPSLGASSTFAFVVGDPGTTHISTAGAGFKVSFKQQAMTGGHVSLFSSDDRWFLQSDGRLQWTSLNVGDLGLERASSVENLKYDWFRLYETTYRRVGDSRLFIGVGLNVSDHTDVRAGSGTQTAFDSSAYAAYSEQHQLSPDRQVSSGTNVSVRIDTRDNPVNASKGWLASAVYRTFFDGFLGGSSTWQEVDLDVRTYRKLTSSGDQRLAFWFLGDLVTGGNAPYFDLPTTAGDPAGRASRGYAEGFYRGPRMLYGEMEYRRSLMPSNLVGMVAFANVTTLDGDQPNQRLFQSFAPAGGLGLRFMLDKRAKANLCTDYAVGRNGSRGFYLAVQEAF